MFLDHAMQERVKFKYAFLNYISLYIILFTGSLTPWYVLNLLSITLGIKALINTQVLININPFVPSVLNIVRLTKISILILRRDPQKNYLWASRPWFSRRKEPILSYVTKNDEKKNPSTWVKAQGYQNF